MLPQITNVKPPVNLASAHLFTRAILADVLPAEHIARHAARRAALVRVRIAERATAAALAGNKQKPLAQVTPPAMLYWVSKEKKKMTEQYVVVDSAVYPIDTLEQIATAIEALRESGLDETPVWHGEPDDPDSYMDSTSKLLTF